MPMSTHVCEVNRDRAKNRTTASDEYEYDEGEPLLDEEAVVDIFLGESARAAELRVLRQTLENRRKTFQRDSVFVAFRPLRFFAAGARLLGRPGPWM